MKKAAAETYLLASDLTTLVTHPAPPSATPTASPIPSGPPDQCGIDPGGTTACESTEPSNKPSKPANVPSASAPAG